MWSFKQNKRLCNVSPRVKKAAGHMHILQLLLLADNMDCQTENKLLLNHRVCDLLYLQQQKKTIQGICSTEQFLLGMSAWYCSINKHTAVTQLVDRISISANLLPFLRQASLGKSSG